MTIKKDLLSLIVASLLFHISLIPYLFYSISLLFHISLNIYLAGSSAKCTNLAVG